RQDPGRTFPGKKMAGDLGSERVTTQSLEVVRVDVERGLILVKGAVPGPKGGWIEVTDAVKGVGAVELPTPGAFRGAGAAPAEEVPVQEAPAEEAPAAEAEAGAADAEAAAEENKEGGE